MSGSTPTNSASSCSIASLPTSQPIKSQFIESLSLEKALLIDFDTDTTMAAIDYDTPATNIISSPNPRKRKRSVDISSPSKGKASDPDSVPTSVAPLLWNISVPSDNKPGESYYCVVLLSKPTYKHPRLHSSEAVEAPRTVGNGSKLMAYFDDETTPRTRYELLIEGTDGHGNTAHAILEARMTLPEICEEYPEYVTNSSLVRLFSREGWTFRLIWNNIPRESRRWSPGGCPWSYIDNALQKQMDKLAAAEASSGVGADQEASENEGTATPATKELRPKTPNWTAEDSDKLLSMRSAGKTHKEIGKELGRSEAACASRLGKLKKAQEAAAGTASDPVELEDGVEPGGQVADPMVLD